MGGRSQEGYSGQRKNEQYAFGDLRLLGSSRLGYRIQVVGQEGEAGREEMRLEE